MVQCTLPAGVEALGATGSGMQVGRVSMVS